MDINDMKDVGSTNQYSNGNEGSWDAHKLVRAYISIAWKISNTYRIDYSSLFQNDPIPFQKLRGDYQIKVRRIAAVISAFTGNDMNESDPYKIIRSVFPYIGEYGSALKQSIIDVSDFELLKAKLCEAASDESWWVEGFLRLFERDSSTDRGDLLSVLLAYRIATENFCFDNIFSGIYEASAVFGIGQKTIEGLYYPKLEECNMKVDDMIVLLLGNTFKGSFTQQELIEHYNYPTTTDEELLDWEAD